MNNVRAATAMTDMLDAILEAKAFGERLESIPSDCTEVHEYIRSGFL